MTRHFRTAAILTLAASTLTLSGCAQINSAADTVWSGTKSAARFVSKPFRSELRDAPEPDYAPESAYAATDAEVIGETVVYADSETTYTPAPAYTQPAYTPSYATGQYYGSEAPRSAPSVVEPDALSYVRLNGQSDMADWQRCETIHRGYWLLDAAGGRINPAFEVCMRNKGYVRETELAMYGLMDSQPIAGQRTASPYSTYTPSYSGYRSLPSSP